MADDSKVGDVYPLFAVDDEDAPVVHIQQSFCAHRKAQLIRSSHKVFCRECGVELDPWERLSAIANDHERRQQQIEALDREIRKRQSELDELKREERNARARKRKRDPAPAPNVDCPECKAKSGDYCKGPSGRRVPTHYRRQIAMQTLRPA